MKKTYQRHAMPILKLQGGVSGQQLAGMSDEALAAYLATEQMQRERRRYVVSDGYLSREIAGESVLVPLDAQAGGRIGLPNETYRFLLEVCSVPRTAQEVVALARARFRDPQGMMEQSIRRHIERAAEMGILKEEE